MDEQSTTWPRITTRLLRGSDLGRAEAAWAMDEIMAGAASPVQLAGFLVALQAKGVSSTELAALAESIITHGRPVRPRPEAVDVVGTGGDLAQTVNISTMAAMVVAATGRTVVKHGNRSASSRSGSADVLEALGIRLDLSVERVEQLIDDVGITFLFAQVFHPSMRHAGEARRGLGVPTVMNLLGPLTNPARPRAGAVGVADAQIAPIVAGVFAARGANALVFRGQDGLDELTVTAPSDVWEVREGQVRRHELDPRELVGIPRRAHEELRGGSAQDNAQVVRDLFAGSREGAMAAIRDAVQLNAAAGISAHDAIGEPAGEDFAERLARAYGEAGEAIDSGAAARLVTRWVEASGDAEGTAD